MTAAQAATVDRGPGLAFGRTTLGDPALTGEDDRRRVLELILRMDPVVMQVLQTARRLALPDWRLASGGVYQTVWNALTRRPAGHGIKDLDLIYFDGETSYDAEDRVITRARPLFAGLPSPVEIRNQARVHLWFREKHGIAYPRLFCTDAALLNYAARTHAVAVRLEADGRLSIAAPFGLADIFAMRLVPNPVLDNAATYMEKAVRMKAAWPEIEIVPWPAVPKPDVEKQDPEQQDPETRAPAMHVPMRQTPAKPDTAGKDAGAPVVSADPSAPHSAASRKRDWMTLSTSPRSELPR